MSVDHIIFIHGRGKSASHDHDWLDGLRFGLGSAGYDFHRHELERLVCRPSYTPYLDRHVKYPVEQVVIRSSEPVPDETIARYEARLHALKDRIGPGYPDDKPAQAIKQVAQRGKLSDFLVRQRFEDVDRYLTDEGRRQKIRQVLLEAIPKTGRCVLIGHSLGSVVTIDLLPFLPAGLEVELLLTIGSPGRIPIVERELGHTARTFPYEKIGAWVNLYDANDVVTGACGLAENLGDASVFDGLVFDHQVENGGVKASHDADRYLAHYWIGELLGPHLTTADSAVPELPDAPVLLAAWFEAAAHAHIRRELVAKEHARSPGSSLEAGMRLADAHLSVAANRSLGLSPRTVLVDAVDDLAERTRTALDSSQAGPTADVDLQMQLFGSPPFAEWGLEIGPSLFNPVVVETSERFGWPAQRTTNILQALKKARACQSKKNAGLPNQLVVGGAVILLAAMATGGAALVAAPGVAGSGAGAFGAAAISSSLASLGGVVGGGMAAGLSVSIGTGAAGGAAVSAMALRSLEPARVVGEVAKVHALALVHQWEGRVSERDRIARELAVLLEDADRRLRVHRSVVRDDDDAPAVQEWKTKHDALRAAVKALA